MSFNEKILMVDDDPGVRDIIKKTLDRVGYSCMEAENGKGLFLQMTDHRPDLILLDIKLPDQDGLTLLPQIFKQDQEVCVVILTGVVDIKTAILAIRRGAFDYLPKPFHFDELKLVVSRALEKRRLKIQNKDYQQNIEGKKLRLEILHDLSIKIAFSLLGTVELEEILRTILVGITAGEGLGFNRAFLALFDDPRTTLQGKIAIGPDGPEEAGRIWASLQERKCGISQAIEEYGRVCRSENTRVNQIVQKIVVPQTDMNNILIRATQERQSFNVKGGLIDDQSIQVDMVDLLGTGDFVVVPLCAPCGVQGVIVADNFFTQNRLPLKTSPPWNCSAIRPVWPLRKASSIPSWLKRLPVWKRPIIN
jgi:FixJ family two-component response regulator